MNDKLSCFVIIGFGKKTSYANGKMRVLDLDETFSLLIKPVFEALNISCYRAIDKNLSGSIDKVMLQEIKNADIALVDITTLNANVMWELGVRHSLMPRHTIMICEKEQMGSIPFDVNHFVVHQYAHSEEGIPYKEVERFRKLLTEVIKGCLEQKPEVTDSPVFTFLEEELNKKGMEKAELAGNPENSQVDSFATMMDKAEEAKNNKEYDKANEILSTMKGFAVGNMTLKDNMNFIICRQALATYKSKKPNELEALIKAKSLLSELKPNESQDLEVLGLGGAIHKRLFELSNDNNYLYGAIQYYEKGFQLKQDYYNGINAAFMLYKKAASLKSQNREWEDIKLKADYIRNTVLEIATKLEAAPNFLESKDAVWVLLTIAEAYNYKKNEVKVKEYENKAKELAEKIKDDFAISSYEEQKQKIKAIFDNIENK